MPEGPNSTARGVSLRLGILIIGSLLWDAEKGRPAWRSARLKLSAAQRVIAPIRYGRYSDSRNSYTMVFSPLFEQSGQFGVGYVVPVGDKLSLEDLAPEADELARVEGLHRRKRNGSYNFQWKAWGAVALLRNPATEIPSKVGAGWKKYFVSRSRDCDLLSQRIRSEKAVISVDGFLQIRWPTCLDSGKGVDLDLLLATPTAPKLKDQNVTTRYPSGGEIAAACEDPTYFVENVRHCIRTMEDLAVWRETLRRRPDWGRTYADVTAIISGAQV